MTSRARCSGGIRCAPCLPDGRIYTLIWTHQYGTSEDLTNHWVISEDGGRTWSEPRPTNLRGQVCTPIPLPDGRVAAIYNFRHEPQGIHVALTEDLEHFDVENEVVVFDAGKEATLGEPENENFLAEHMQIAFGKPGGTTPAGRRCDDLFLVYCGGSHPYALGEIAILMEGYNYNDAVDHNLTDCGTKDGALEQGLPGLCWVSLYLSASVVERFYWI